jgi:hypothetical protein
MSKTKAEMQLDVIRAILVIMYKQLSEKIGDELDETGDDVFEFLELPDSDKWKWFHRLVYTPREAKEYGIRRALFMCELGTDCLDIEELDEALSFHEAARAALELCMLADNQSSFEKAKSELAKQAVKAKLLNSPKQKAKEFIKDCWLTWQEEPERYKSKAEFAREMLKQEQCKSLVSQIKITDWCRGWEKSHHAG